MPPTRERSAQRLLVFLPPHRSLSGKQGLASSTVVSYVALGGGNARDAAGETPVALLPKAAQADLVFDTGDVFVAAIDAPKLSEARLRQALPNLLEERVLADPADCQFAFEMPRSGGTTTIAGTPKLPVAVIDRGLLTRALDVLAEAGYKARAAYSEIYTVPAPGAGVLSVRADRGRGIARSGRHDGFAFDLGEPGAEAEVPPALLLAVRQLGIKRISAYGRDAERVFRLAGPLGVTVDLAGREADAGAIDGAVNLLQGSFAQRSALTSFALGRLRSASLRPLAIWGAVAAATFVAGMNLHWLKLEGEARALRTGMETAFRSAFPEASAVVDPVLQTKRQLGQLRSRAGIPSADDFTVLNAQAAQLMSMAPVGSVGGVEYRDGTLRVKFKAGGGLDPGLQNSLRAQAIQLGLNLRFDSDGSARLSPAGQ
jgi:general secretion pathway protein L